MDVHVRVRVQRLFPDLAVPHPQILLEDRDDEALGNFKLMVFQDETSDLTRACNLIATGTELYYRLHHNFLVVDMLLLLLDHQVHVVLVLLGAVDQLTKADGFDGVSLGYILDGSTIYYNLAKHFDFVAKAVTGQLLHRMYSGRGSLV